tara:strand:- start:76 stop:492 length:417 start_codon:yes stop_codon:yes gene_type:complete
MTRNNKGGKQHRKSKGHGNATNIQIEFKESGQEYALISKLLGNGRCECKCADGMTRLGHIRGTMRKRVWINMGDTVLVSLREYQDQKADIIHKYSFDEVKKLLAYGEIQTVVTAQSQDLCLNENSNMEDLCPIDFDEI